MTRPQYVQKIVLLCLIAVLLVSTINIGIGQAVNTASSAKKYVVFRCDDVAPNVNFAEVQALNEVHVDMNVPVTLGIVPHATTGTGNELLADSQFVAYMKSLASNPLFEFAQHGYMHQKLGVSTSGPSEFYGRPYVAQYNAIKQGRDDIHAAFGVTPTSFIPPFDKGDDNTLKAAKTLGFTEYSTSLGDFNVNEGIKEGVNIQAVSLALANENLQSAESKTNQFFNDLQSTDTFVVLYHPYEFRFPNGSVNKERITLLENYIDYLKGRGDVQFTTLDRSGTGSAVSLSTGTLSHLTPATDVSTRPTNDTGSTQQKAPAPSSVQQTGTTLPSVQAGSTLIGGLRGSFTFLLVGTISALVLAACLVLFRGHMKRLR